MNRTFNNIIGGEGMELGTTIGALIVLGLGLIWAVLSVKSKEGGGWQVPYVTVRDALAALTVISLALLLVPGGFLITRVLAGIGVIFSGLLWGVLNACVDHHLFMRSPENSKLRRFAAFCSKISFLATGSAVVAFLISLF